MGSMQTGWRQEQAHSTVMVLVGWKRAVKCQ